ncbi:unnamed protein product, partial [Symbiodinium sp. KB8]
DGDGTINIEELQRIVDAAKLSKESRLSFDLSVFPKALHGILKNFDVDDDGSVSATELATAATLYQNQRKQNKLFRRLLVGSAVFLVLLLLGILGLSYAMYVVTKETKMGGDGVMRSTTTGDAVMTGSADFALGPNGELSPRSLDSTPSDLFSGAAHAHRYARALQEDAEAYDTPAISTRSAYQHRRLTSNLPDSYFEELRFLKVMSPSGNSLALKVEGLLRAIEPGSACGSVLKILTAAGTIQVDGFDLTFTDESVAEAFAVAGFQVQSTSTGRRLNGLVSLLGLFNTIGPYQFECPLVVKPSMPEVWAASSTTFTPCTPDKYQGQADFASPCEPPTSENAAVQLPPVVDYNGGKYIRTLGQVGSIGGVSVGVSYDSEKSNERMVTVVEGDNLLNYRMVEGIAVSCQESTLEAVSALAQRSFEDFDFAYVSREVVGGEDVHYFMLRGEVNTPEGGSRYAIVHFYQSISTGLPVRIVDDYGSITDYRHSTADPSAVRALVDAYAIPDCDPLNNKLLKSAFEHEQDNSMENMEPVPENEARRLMPARRLTVEEDAPSSYFNASSGVTITNLGGMKALRWVIDGSNGIQCVSSTSTPGDIAPAVCDLYDALQKFTWQGSHIVHPFTGTCVGADSEDNVKLVSCTSTAALDLIPNVPGRRIIIEGTDKCLNLAMVQQTPPEGEEIEDMLSAYPSLQIGACDTSFAVRVLTDLELQDSSDPNAPIVVSDEDLDDEASAQRRLYEGRLLQSKRRALYRNPDYPHDLDNLPPLTMNARMRTRRLSSRLTSEEEQQLLEDAKRDPEIRTMVTRAAAEKAGRDAARELNRRKNKKGNSRDEFDLSEIMGQSCEIEFNVPLGCNENSCKIAMCIDFVSQFLIEGSAEGMLYGVITVTLTGSLSYDYAERTGSGSVTLTAGLEFDVWVHTFTLAQLGITIGLEYTYENICQIRWVHEWYEYWHWKRHCRWYGCWWYYGTSWTWRWKAEYYNCWRDYFWNMFADAWAQVGVAKGTGEFDLRLRDGRKSFSINAYYQEFWKFWSSDNWKKFATYQLV